jgi:glutaredoxin
VVSLLEDAVATMAGELRQSFGAKVEVKYIDTDLDGLEAYPAVARVINTGCSFPIIFINGEPRLAGCIDIEAIRTMLAEGNPAD